MLLAKETPGNWDYFLLSGLKEVGDLLFSWSNIIFLKNETLLNKADCRILKREGKKLNQQNTNPEAKQKGNFQKLLQFISSRDGAYLQLVLHFYVRPLKTTSKYIYKKKKQTTCWGLFSFFNWRNLFYFLIHITYECNDKWVTMGQRKANLFLCGPSYCLRFPLLVRKALESCKERKLFYFYGKGSAKSSVFNIFINFERRASLM